MYKIDKKIREKMKNLKSLGWTHKQIADKFNIAKSSVSYHLNSQTKESAKIRGKKRRQNLHPYYKKIDRFIYPDGRKHNRRISYISSNTNRLIYDKIKNFYFNGRFKMEITVDDVIEKFGENPQCYLTGEDIDMSKTYSYAFDHIIPRSRNGKNTIDNLGICTYQANKCKSDLTPDELIQFCEKVLKHHGYKIEGPQTGIEPA